MGVTQNQKRLGFFSLLSCFLLLFVGCGKPTAASPQKVVTATNIAPSAPAPAETGVPGPDQKVCFACNGEGTVPCPAPGCKDGMVDCPGPCLKLSKGVWTHTDIDGKPSDLWWQYFNSADDSYTFGVSEHHLGEVIVVRDGKPTLGGKCKICGGTGKVKCRVCNGTGKVACPVCGGKKFVPIAWTPADNPYFNRQPDIIRLADGRVLLGRIAAEAGEDRTIITRDKKILHVNISDILPKETTNSATTQTAPGG
jgi:hypothetical protein